MKVNGRTSEVIRLELVALSVVSYFSGEPAFRGSEPECVEFIARELGKRARRNRFRLPTQEEVNA